MEAAWRGDRSVRKKNLGRGAGEGGFSVTAWIDGFGTAMDGGLTDVVEFTTRKRLVVGVGLGFARAAHHGGHALHGGVGSD